MTGTFRKYRDFDFRPATLVLIAQVNKVIDEYEGRGFSLTLRQIYYQLVARGLIENKDSEYNRLGGAVSDGRLAGMISWSAIEDRNRELRGLNHYDSPHHLMSNARKDYRLDKWATQKVRPEVWVEKAALEGVIGGICNKLQVDFFACRGYNSQSEQWRAGRRLAGYVQRGQVPIIFHLGDHDPSGIDMTRDNQERLSMFAGVPVQVTRLALNMNQIESLRPPPNPTKMSDSRAPDYVSQYGYDSWELDALSPDFINDLIRDAVLKFRDGKAWQEMVAQEAADLRRLDMVVEELEE